MRGRIALTMFVVALSGRAEAQDAVAAATERLDRAFKEKSETDAVEAIRQAAKTVDPKVIQLIAKGLRVKSPSVNAEAMKALGSMRHPDALKALHDTYWWAKRAGLIKKNDGLFALLLKSIGRHEDPSSLKVLTDSPFKHITAANGTARIMAIGRIRSRESAKVLVEAGKLAGSYGRRSRNFQDWKGLFDMPYRVAMTVLTGNDLGASRQMWQDWWKSEEGKGFQPSAKRPKVPKEVQEFWEKYWDEPYFEAGKEPTKGALGSPYGRSENPSADRVKAAVTDIEAAFKAKKAEVKIAAIQANADVIDPKVVRAIAKGLRDRDDGVQKAAVDALGWMKHKEGLKQLHRMYRRNKDLHKKEVLFAALLKAIGRHGDKSSITVLSSDPFKRLTVASGRARVLGLARIRQQESLVTLMKGLRLAGTLPFDYVASAEPQYEQDFRAAFVVLTGIDQGESQKAWEAWWQKNRRKFRVAKEWPEVPADVKEFWENYWEEPYGEG
ncbi:MAG: HEAT repeat domain-containing protein [Planctomycetota bacterium]|jgi:hypothetical protein